MKVRNRLLLLLIAVAVLALAGCQTSPADSGKALPAVAKNPKKIVIATNAEFPPFEYVAQEGEGAVGGYDGIDIMIAVEIARDIGAEAVIENMKFDDIIGALESGKADFAIAAMTIEPGRLDSLDFSIPYWIAAQTIIVREDNTDIVDVESLRGKRVGVAAGYTGEAAVAERLGKENVIRYPNGAEAISELASGKLEAVVIDSTAAESFINIYPGIKTVNDNYSFKTEEYAVAVKKGNTELLERINLTLERLLIESKISDFAMEVDSKLAVRD